MPVRNKMTFLLTVSLAGALALASCTPKKKSLKDSTDAEAAAITAASRKMFGTNVRGYMWVLAEDINHDEQMHQCWYYAETSPEEYLTGDKLDDLFADPTRTRNSNSHYVNARFFFEDFNRDEQIRKFVFWGLTAVSGGLCTWAAIPNPTLIGPLCGIGMAAVTSFNSYERLGDWSGGTTKAKEHALKQMTVKRTQLDDVNWEVIEAIRRRTKAYNDPKLKNRRTRKPCPPPSRELLERFPSPDAAPAAAGPGSGSFGNSRSQFGP